MVQNDFSLFGNEHYELLTQFERDCKDQIGRTDKELKEIWQKGHIYQDGPTNAIFLAYRKGYAYGKAVGISSFRGERAQWPELPPCCWCSRCFWCHWRQESLMCTKKLKV